MQNEKAPTEVILIVIMTLLISPVFVFVLCAGAALVGIELKAVLMPVAVIAAAIPIMRALKLNLGILLILIPSVMIAGIRGASTRAGSMYLTVLGLFFFCGFTTMMSMFVQGMVENVLSKGKRWRYGLIGGVIGLYLLAGGSYFIDQLIHSQSKRVAILPYDKLNVEDRMSHLLYRNEKWPQEQAWATAFDDVVQQFVQQEKSLQKIMYQMPLHRYGMRGLKILLEHGADINGGNGKHIPKYGFLQRLINSGNMKMIYFAIEQGFDVTQTVYNKTALHIVCESSGQEVVPLFNLLLTSDIDINQKKTDGTTALEICAAAKNAQHEMVEALLQKGAKLPRMSGSGYPDRFDRFEAMFRQYHYKNDWID